MDNNTYTQCPVPNCTGRYKTRISMRQHFQNRHWNDAILITEEGQLPQCNKCLLFTSNALSLRHQNSKSCAAGQARRERREQQLSNEQGESATITIKGTAVENVDSFRYLGRILTANGDDRLAIAYNLQKAKKSWKRVQTILRRQGATPKTSGNFYKAIVQAILLYGSETWNVTSQQLKILNGFHNNVTRNLSNHRIRRAHTTSDVWIYPNILQAQQATGLQPLKHYIQLRRRNLLFWTQNRPIFLAARQLERRQGGHNILWGPTMDDDLDPFEDEDEPTTPGRDATAQLPNHTTITPILRQYHTSPQQALTTPNPTNENN
jgi:hypothetical protein